MKKFKVLITILSLLAVVGCGKIEPTKTETSIMTINGKAITQSNYDKIFNDTIQNSFLAKAKVDFNDPKYKQLKLLFKNQAINQIIIKELLDQEAKNRKITVSEKEIDESIEKIAFNIGGKESLFKKLEENKIDKNEFLADIKDSLLKKKLVESISSSKVSDDDAKKFYEDNKESKFKTEEMVRAKHILISANADEIKAKIEATDNNISKDDISKKIKEAFDKARKKAEKFQKELAKAPKKFEEYAKQYSEDPSCASEGGDLGFFEKKEMVPEFSEAAFKLKPGTISKVIKTDFGYHIIKGVDRKPAGYTEFKTVKDDIKNYLSEIEKIKALGTVLEAAKNKATIVYTDDTYNPQNIEGELKKIQQVRTKAIEQIKKEAEKAKKDVQTKAEDKAKK